MHVRAVITVSLAGLLLTACGSGASAPQTSPAIETASGGAVAGDVADCPQGPPARDGFRVGGLTNDGVVGTLANDTSEAVYVVVADGPSPSARPMCRLAPGKSVAYAGHFEGRDDIWLYVSRLSHDYVPRGGTKVSLEDPWIGSASAQGDGFYWAMSVREWKCPRDAGREESLSENESWWVDDEVLGKFVVTRLDDNANAAREYVGTSSSKVDDWARIDVRISRVGDCSFKNSGNYL